MIRGFCKICVSAGGGLRHCSAADRCGNWRLISVGAAPHGPPTLVSLVRVVENLAQCFSSAPPPRAARAETREGGEQ